MGNFWDCITEDQKGRAYADLAQLYYQLCKEKLLEPKGLRGESEREPDIINAPSYQEEQEIELDKFMRGKPHHPRRTK